MFKKIGDTVSKVWTFLEGKKRRVAFVCGVVAQTTKPHTVINQVAELGFYLFGGADLAKAGKDKFKKLPSGLSGN